MNTVLHFPRHTSVLELQLREANAAKANDNETRNLELESRMRLKLTMLLQKLNLYGTPDLVRMLYQGISPEHKLEAEGNKTTMLNQILPDTNATPETKTLLEKTYYVLQLALVVAEKTFTPHQHPLFVVHKPIVATRTSSRATQVSDSNFQETHAASLSEYEQLMIDTCISVVRLPARHAHLPEPLLRQFLQAILLYKKVTH